MLHHYKPVICHAATMSLLCCATTCNGSASESEQHSGCVSWCISPHMASHHPTSLTCASRLPPCQHDDCSARLPVVISSCQGCKSSSATRHLRWLAQKRGTACQSTSGYLKLSLHSRVTWWHICLIFYTAHSDESSDGSLQIDVLLLLLLLLLLFTLVI